jgi:ethanolamine-phosphate cytidylyltransferase
MPSEDDPYADAKKLGIFEQVPEHGFQDVNAGEIVQRILRQRETFVERQRRKGDKAVIEAEARRKELENERKSAK